MLKYEVLHMVLTLTALTVFTVGLLFLRHKLYRYGNKY